MLLHNPEHVTEQFTTFDGEVKPTRPKQIFKLQVQVFIELCGKEWVA
jgi:hypothetical protein